MAKKVKKDQRALRGGTGPTIGKLVLERMQKQGLLGSPEKKLEVPKPNISMANPLPQGSKWPDHWPECPETYNKNEWARALKNTDLYLEECLQDNLNKPWFFYPKYDYQYSELLYLTPEMCAELLKHMPLNRPISTSHVETIMRDIENNRWIQTDEPISVNTLGQMNNGMHRSLAIVRLGKGWPFYFTWNVPPESIYVKDSGKKRNINDKLSILFPENKINQKSAALCRSMMWGTSGRGITYSESEIAEFAVKYQDVVQWVGNKMRSFRADLQAVVAKALLWWGEDVVGPFVHRFVNIQFNDDSDPAKTLYIWVQRAKTEGRRTHYISPILYYKKALTAIYAHANDKKVSRLHQQKEDVFEWLPGWEIPESRPCKGEVFSNN